MSTERPIGGRAASARSQATAPPPGRLPPDHDCRRDDPRYPDLSAWWADHHGEVPIQMPMALGHLTRERGLPFGEAFTRLVDTGDIGLARVAVQVPGDATGGPPRRRRVWRAAFVSVRAAHPESLDPARRRSGRGEHR